MGSTTSRLLSLAVLVASPVLAAPPADRARDRQALVAALTSVVRDSPLKDARLTLQVRSLDDGTVVFSRDADELLNPASNVKLFTAAAALARLGPEYRFETEFLTDPDFRKGKAKALYVRGKGDPSITTEKLTGIVAELVHAGLAEVQDIVLDESYFDGELPPGFDQESGDRPYLAPPGALSLNWNAVGVYVRPGEGVGDPAAVEVEPPSDYFVVSGGVRTGTRRERRFTVTSSLEKDRVHQKLEVNGVVPVETGVWTQWKKVDRPALYFGYTLKDLLRRRGVKVRGRVRTGAVPPAQKVLHVAQSETLDLVLKRLNKNSSNFVAEQLIKTLGAVVKGEPGTSASGIAVVEEYLEREVGLRKGSYVMKNGSGLNDTNRFSAAQTNRLLVAMMDRFSTMPEFLSALGIAGKDGTLRYRFEGSEAVGRLRAKTGTLDNVTALSGYVQSVGGERFVFSIMVNDFAGRAGQVVPYVDVMGAAVAAAGSPAAGPSAVVAAMTSLPRVMEPMEQLKAQLRTYTALARQLSPRNVAFLRTAWRSEQDPAVRAIVADALYQSDPREGASVRILLDSASAADEVHGRIAAAAGSLGLDVPVVGALAELAAQGNVEATLKLLDYIHASRGDAAAFSRLAEGLVVAATDAPAEVITALKLAREPARSAGVDALVEGLVQSAQPSAPLWPALNAARGSPDPTMAEFARGLESTLAVKIAMRKAPVLPVARTGDPLPPPRPTDPVTPVPGG